MYREEDVFHSETAAGWGGMNDSLYYHRNEKIHFQSSTFGDKSNNSDLLQGNNSCLNTVSD
jgi:hypothetical protein